MKLFPQQARLELSVSEAPDWWSDAESYTLAEVDLGQVRATIYKSSDRVLHVYVLAGDRAAREELALTALQAPPLFLVIGWDQDEVRLGLDSRQTTRHPWRTLPLPPRP